MRSVSTMSPTMRLEIFWLSSRAKVIWCFVRWRGLEYFDESHEFDASEGEETAKTPSCQFPTAAAIEAAWDI
ncbi:hypothetical protein PM082_004682 [Marasmius tenuissimus]|nr:hypothetical protein PM082_004682 [Marasmius tenuissimus]